MNIPRRAFLGGSLALGAMAGCRTAGRTGGASVLKIARHVKGVLKECTF